MHAELGEPRASEEADLGRRQVGLLWCSCHLLNFDRCQWVVGEMERNYGAL